MNYVYETVAGDEAQTHALRSAKITRQLLCKTLENYDFHELPENLSVLPSEGARGHSN